MGFIKKRKKEIEESRQELEKLRGEMDDVRKRLQALEERVLLIGEVQVPNLSEHILKGSGKPPAAEEKGGS